MNTRRQFFGNLFKGIVVAGTAPSMPSRQIVTKKLESVPNLARPIKLKATATWTAGMEQDLYMYGIYPD